MKKVDIHSRGWSKGILAPLIVGLALTGAIRAQPPGQGGPAKPEVADLVGSPEFVAELKDRGNDGVVRIFLDNHGPETALKVVPRGSGICKTGNDNCAGELTFVTVGRALLPNEKVVITGVSDERCFAANVFELTLDSNPVATGAPQDCGKGDVWMYKIEFMIDGEVVGDPIDPGVLIDDGPGT